MDINIQRKKKGVQMNVIFMLIFFSILIAGGFLIAFFISVKSGQYEDLNTPSMRVYLDDEPHNTK